jgi:hypothetical protein
MGQIIPTTMRMKSNDAKTYYPFAVSLQEALRTYNQSCQKVGKDIEKLIAEHKKQI